MNNTDTQALMTDDGWLQEYTLKQKLLQLTEDGWLTLTVTVPDTLSISPSRAERSEDFPDPTTPTTATSDPSSTSRLMLKQGNGPYHIIAGHEIKNEAGIRIQVG